MRNPERIDKFCDTLKNYWHQVPDWRLGQLLVNSIRGTYRYPDLFYVEDDELMYRLETMFANESENNDGDD